MKAKLTFDLSNQDDKVEFERVNSSIAMACALFDILRLRKSLSNQFDGKEGDALDGIAVMANEIGEIMEKYNLDIDRLI